jgi:hypothetical protein
MGSDAVSIGTPLVMPVTLKRLAASLILPNLSDGLLTLSIQYKVTVPVNGSQLPGSLIQAADRSRPVMMMSGSLLWCGKRSSEDTGFFRPEAGAVRGPGTVSNRNGTPSGR